MMFARKEDLEIFNIDSLLLSRTIITILVELKYFHVFNQAHFCFILATANIYFATALKSNVSIETFLGGAAAATAKFPG